VRSDLPGGAGLDLALDVTDEAAWAAAAREIERRHGRLDGLVNNAGVVFVGTVEATSLAQWRRVMDVNLDGVVSRVSPHAAVTCDARRRLRS